MALSTDASRTDMPDDGSRMSLIEHLRELRNRLLIACAAIVIGILVAWFFYADLFDLLLHPLKVTIAHLPEEQQKKIQPFASGVAGAFLLKLKVSLVAGIIGTSPIWLYEIWAFILPGLHRNEKKWTYIFVSIAGPLFLAGIALGYWVMPKGIEVMLGFTPNGISNFIDTGSYLNFILRVLLVFGISFEIPLFVVLLNLAGIVSGRQLGRWRSYIIFATFVFAAVATPSTDPITMLLLAIPMTILFLISEVIARFIDRRRGRNSEEPEYDDFDDDETSDI